MGNYISSLSSSAETSNASTMSTPTSIKIVNESDNFNVVVSSEPDAADNKGEKEEKVEVQTQEKEVKNENEEKASLFENDANDVVFKKQIFKNKKNNKKNNNNKNNNNKKNKNKKK